MIDLSTLEAKKQLASKYAAKYLLDTALICAVAEHESSWNPYATRMEKAFYTKYVQQMTLNDTEEYTRSMSFGLMQIMGETARELGFVKKPGDSYAEFLTQLTDPDIGMDFGCKKLRRCLDLHPNDEVAALLAYNGGSDPTYPVVVQKLKPTYY